LDDLPAVENSGLTSYRDLFLRGKLRKNQPVFAGLNLPQFVAKPCQMHTKV